MGEQLTVRPLAGRVALVTGVSRRVGIGHAIAGTLAGLGADLFVASWAPHDADQPWGADPAGLDGSRGVLAGLATARPGVRVEHLAIDLADPGAPDALVAAAIDAFGRLDVLVCNHARSGGDGPLGELDAGMLDAHWAVNARSSILLVQAFATRFVAARPGARLGEPGSGRVVLLTSGQDQGPMPGEVAYAATKGALSAITATLADQLADVGIAVNTVNPGPVDTGYATEPALSAVAARFPAGRWGRPADAARLVGWLATDDAGWVTGQVINSEGGFRRWDRDRDR